MELVDFDQYVVGVFEIGRSRPHGGGQVDPAVGDDFSGFDDGEVQLSVKAGQNRLGKL